MNRTKSFLAVYILVAVITFGHAYRRVEPQIPKEMPEGGAVIGALDAAAWPLYWSVVAWEKADARTE